MSDVELFQQALGLTRPWKVTGSEFDAAGRRLDIYIDFEKGGTFACPECGRAGCNAHDTTEKTWRHLNFFQHEAYLHVRTPRVECAEHGVKLAEVPWARHGSGFTLLLQLQAAVLSAGAPEAPATDPLRSAERAWPRHVDPHHILGDTLSS